MIDKREHVQQESDMQAYSRTAFADELKHSTRDDLNAQNEKPPISRKIDGFGILVAGTGFEPVTFGL